MPVNKLTQEEAFRRMREVHGDKYICEKTKYTGSNHKLILKCKKHGEFSQRYSRCIQKNVACPKCNIQIKVLNSMLTQEEAIRRCREEHYPIDYTCEKTIYKSSHEKMIFNCLIHGEFRQSYTNHVHGKCICPKCSEVYFKSSGGLNKLTQEEAFRRMREVHGDKYICEKTKYTGLDQRLILNCEKHGEFKQLYGNHVYQKTGCPDCAHENHPGGYTYKFFKKNTHLKNTEAIFYMLILSNTEEEFLKIGITINKVNTRTNHLPYDVKVLREEHMTLFKAFCKEQEEKELYKHLKYEPKIHFGGHTECFTLELLSE